MGCTISIKNSTDSTPEIIMANLTGCHWLPHFSLAPPKPISPSGRVVGMVEGGVNYQIKLSTRFYRYQESVDTTIIVKDGKVELSSKHTDHILNSATFSREGNEVIVYIEYATWDSSVPGHPIPMPAGRRGKVIVRAGTVSSLIIKIEEDGGRAHGISVNESLQDYSDLLAALKELTGTGGVFKSSKYVAIGWKQDIEYKRGTFRSDPLKDNKYHALLDNLEAKQVGGVFQQMNNPNYKADDPENDTE
jgi:hypothetical protein